MKRAEVFQSDTGTWLAGLDHDPHHPDRDRRAPIANRRYAIDPEEFPTHAEALNHALDSVGLTTPPEHKEPS